MKLAFSKGLNYIYLGAGFFRSAVADLFFLRPALIGFASALLLNIVTWLFTIALTRSIGSDIAILHYNVIFGIDKVGEGVSLYALPLAALEIFVINFVVAALIAGKKNALLIYILAAGSFLASAIILVALYFIYLVNFS